MDSLTHIVLGAAIGEVMLGRQIGRKAAAIGALAKTIPDFDLFYTGLKDPFMYMCHHRGHTHSLLWETLYALPLAYIFFRLLKKEISFLKWLSLFLICLWGHSMLDVCTNYGTRLFLPVTNHAYSFNNLAIVDLFFTLPMLIMLIIGLCYHKTNKNRIILMRGVLIYCFVYLGYTFGNKVYANHLFEKSLLKNKISYDKSMTNPTILNNFLWYGIAANDTQIFIAENSLLFPSPNPIWHSFARNRNLLDSHPDARTAALKWFSNGYDISKKEGDTLTVYTIKFGRTNMKEDSLKKTFIFHYKLYQAHGRPQFTMEEPSSDKVSYKEGFIDLYERILGKVK